MVKKLIAASILVTLLSMNAVAQDAKTVIANVNKAMGAEKLNSITYSGSAMDVSFLQCGAMVCGGGINLPMRPVTNYVRAIDLSAPASRMTGNTMNPPGGAQTGPPAPGVLNSAVTAAQVTNPATVWGNQLELWITPWGFLKGAAANNGTVKMQKVSGKNYTVLSWSPAVKALSGASYVVNGYVNDQNMIDRVETWFENDVMGDMHILVVYSDYKDFGGVKVPTKMVQTRGSYAYFDTTVTSAQANPTNIAVLIAGPAPAAPAGGAPRGAGAPPAGGAPPLPAARGAGGPPAGAPAGAQRGAAPAAAPVAAPAPASEKMADGVYRITAGPGSYVSLAVEFKDFIMLLEGGNTPARATAIITEAKRVIPNKPIRYVMNTHYHSDHSGGLATMVAEGATIITHENNKAFFEKVYSTPRTLLATSDPLAKNPRKPMVEGVKEKKVIKDSTRTVEIYHTAPVPHTDGMLIAYLPKEKIIFQGDFSLPAACQPANDHIKALMPILDRLKLDYTTYIPVHANTPDVVWTKADVMKAVGRTN